MKVFTQKHPVVTFLLINFAWTWLFWLGAIPLCGQDLLITMVVMIGGFGPAIGGILTLGLKHGMKPEFSLKKLITMGIASLVIFALIALRYLTGNVPNYGTLAENLSLTAQIVVPALLASLVGGWVYSSALSRNANIRERMASILPWRLPVGWNCSLSSPLLAAW